MGTTTRDDDDKPPITHYCDWDALGKHVVRAICGTVIRRRDHSNEPTCLQCQQGLKYRESVGRP